MSADSIPTIGAYRGVALHADQDEGRLAVVHADIDAVFSVSDLGALARVATDVSKAPEARSLALAKVEAGFERNRDLHTNQRRDIDIDRLRAQCIGLNSLSWQSPTHFCSLFDHRRPGHQEPVARKVAFVG